MSGDDRSAQAGCAAWDEDLSALLDGALAPSRAAEVRAHVAACARCDARAVQLARARSLVAELLRAPATGDEAARVGSALAALHARLAAEAVAAGHERSRRAPRRPRPAGVMLRYAAAFAVAAAVALVLLRFARAPRPPPPPASVPQIARETPAPAERLPAAAPPQEALASSPSTPAVEPEVALASAGEEDLDVALHLDTLEDLDVIERLDLLEQLAALEPPEGSG